MGQAAWGTGRSLRRFSLVTLHSSSAPSARRTPKSLNRPTPTSPPSRPASSPGTAPLSLTARHSDHRELRVTSRQLRENRATPAPPGAVRRETRPRCFAARAAARHGDASSRCGIPGQRGSGGRRRPMQLLYVGEVRRCRPGTPEAAAWSRSATSGSNDVLGMPTSAASDNVRLVVTRRPPTSRDGARRPCCPGG